MRPDIAYVQSCFDSFNEMCFGSSLPAVPIKLSNAKTFLGKLEYRYVRNFWGKITGRKDYVMKISTRYDLPESEVQDTVLHEMIHYYIAVNGIKDTSTHGREFRRIMADINARYGRHVTISHRAHLQDETVKEHHVCVCTFRDGTVGLAVVAASRYESLRRRLPRYFALASMEWYTTKDPYFNRFPHSRTPKIYLPDMEEVMRHLQATGLSS